jgi:hypothetical protein
MYWFWGKLQPVACIFAKTNSGDISAQALIEALDRQLFQEDKKIALSFTSVLFIWYGLVSQ